MRKRHWIKKCRKLAHNEGAQVSFRYKKDFNLTLKKMGLNVCDSALNWHQTKIEYNWDITGLVYVLMIFKEKSYKENKELIVENIKFDKTQSPQSLVINGYLITKDESKGVNPKWHGDVLKKVCTEHDSGPRFAPNSRYTYSTPFVEEFKGLSLGPVAAFMMTLDTVFGDMHTKTTICKIKKP